MNNKYRVWDKLEGKMILPDGEVGTTGEWPSTLAVGLHGLPIAFDTDSFKPNKITGWNIDHNRVLMRYTDLKDREGVEIVAGDLRVLNGKMYKVVDWGWCFQFERNMVEFHENDMILLNEDSAYESSLVGDIYNNEHLLLNYKDEL